MGKMNLIVKRSGQTLTMIWLGSGEGNGRSRVSMALRPPGLEIPTAKIRDGKVEVMLGSKTSARVR